jgi:hypothetical protein
METNDAKTGSDNPPTQNVLSESAPNSSQTPPGVPGGPNGGEEVKAAPAWEQQNGETAKHFSWFQTYLTLGEARSLLGAYNRFRAKSLEKSQKVFKPVAAVSPAWREVSEKWNWKARAASWDAQERLEAEARRKAREIEREEEYAQKRREQKFKLADIIERMQKFPIQEIKTENDGKTVIVMPAGWNFNTLARLMQVQEQLADDDETTVTVKGKNVESAAVAVKTRSKSAEEYSDEELIAVVVAGGLRKQNPEPDAKPSE